MLKIFESIHTGEYFNCDHKGVNLHDQVLSSSFNIEHYDLIEENPIWRIYSLRSEYRTAEKKARPVKLMYR
jgi:hypothetical protein